MTTDNGVKASLWKTVALLATLLVAVATFALTNVAVSDKVNNNDKRIALNEERIQRISQDISEIKSNQEKTLLLLQETMQRNR
jgi:Tfp pilus assembly protein PilN